MWCSGQRTHSPVVGAFAQAGGCDGSSHCRRNWRTDGDRSIGEPPQPLSARALGSGRYSRLAAARTPGPQLRVPVRSQAAWHRASAWPLRRRDDRRSRRQAQRDSAEGARDQQRLGRYWYRTRPSTHSELTLFQFAIFINRRGRYRPQWNREVIARIATFTGSPQAAFENQIGEISRRGRW